VACAAVYFSFSSQHLKHDRFGNRPRRVVTIYEFKTCLKMKKERAACEGQLWLQALAGDHCPSREILASGGASNLCTDLNKDWMYIRKQYTRDKRGKLKLEWVHGKATSAAAGHRLLYELMF
jgi:hypothetical protein